jgi:hypothetical protein
VLDARLAMRNAFLLLLLFLPLPLSIHAEDLGELSANSFNPDSTSWAAAGFKDTELGV